MNADQRAQRELIEKIADLPEDIRNAFGCLITNYDTIMQMCKTKALTEEERRQIIDLAQQRNNPTILVLALFERYINRRNSP